jgi:hypothetical protein
VKDGAANRKNVELERATAAVVRGSDIIEVSMIQEFCEECR